MKRLAAFIVLVIYMASAIGFTFSLHYCGGAYKQLCFTSDTEKGCCEKSEHKTKCCTDNTVTAKIKDDHSSVLKIILHKRIADKTLITHSHLFVASLHQGFARQVSFSSSPPILPDIPIYLMNNVFRI